MIPCDHALIIGIRCRTSSCSICARTCTSLPPSLPPTPDLSYSPSPPESPSSGRRSLPTDLDQTPRARARAQAVTSHTESSKRRKRKEDDDDDATVIGVDEFINEKVLSSVLPGCGRKVCRSCCIENLQWSVWSSFVVQLRILFTYLNSGTTTCYDCFGIPLSDHHEHGENKQSSVTEPSIPYSSSSM